MKFRHIYVVRNTDNPDLYYRHGRINGKQYIHGWDTFDRATILEKRGVLRVLKRFSNAEIVELDIAPHESIPKEVCVIRNINTGLYVQRKTRRRKYHRVWDYFIHAEMFYSLSRAQWYINSALKYGLYEDLKEDEVEFIRGVIYIPQGDKLKDAGRRNKPVTDNPGHETLRVEEKSE